MRLNHCPQGSTSLVSSPRYPIHGTVPLDEQLIQATKTNNIELVKYFFKELKPFLNRDVGSLMVHAAFKFPHLFRMCVLLSPLKRTTKPC